MLRRGKKDDNAPANPDDPPALNAKAIKELYDKGVQSIRQETFNWWLNFAFIQGHQWLYYNRQTFRLDEIPRDPDRVQATINRLLPASRTIIAKATSREMRFEVTPTKADDATVRSARLAESIIADLHRAHDWVALREDAVWAMWRGGTSAICVEWDAEAGDILEQGENGKRVGTGDTIETVLNIAEFVVEPGARSAEKARYWIRAQALPPSEVQAKYRLKDKPESDATAGLSPLQHRLLAESGTSRGEQPPLTLVLTYFERPNFLRPKGAIATVVGDKVVDGPVDWYFPRKDRLNIAVMRETHVDGRWTGETVVTSARPVQALYNQSWSSVIEHMKLAGNARLAVPQSAIDYIQMVTDEPGELIPYPDGTDKPGWLSPPQMPAWWIEQPEKLEEQIDDILGLHAVSRGEAPANIQSGYGLSILSENDATPLGRLVKETATAWEKVASMCLELYEAKAGETREAKILTPGQAPETAEWKGSDIDGQTNAIIPIGAVLPRNQVAMQAMADHLVQMGLVTGLPQYFHIAEFPDQAHVLDAVSPDVSRSRRENYELALGKACVPETYDDHAVHIKEHNDFRKSAKFSILQAEEPQTAALVDLHVKAHEVLAAEVAGNQVSRGMISPALATAPNADGTSALPPGAPLPEPGVPQPTLPGAPPGLPPAGMDEAGVSVPPPAPAL